MPTKHHLPKHSTPAYPKWKEARNLRAQFKKFQGKASDEHGLPPAKFFHTCALTRTYPHPHSRVAGPVTYGLRDPRVPKPMRVWVHGSAFQMKAHENSIFYGVTKCARGPPPHSPPQATPRQPESLPCEQILIYSKPQGRGEPA